MSAGSVNVNAAVSESASAMAMSNLAASKLGASSSRVILAPRGTGNGGVVVGGNQNIIGEKEGECAQQ